jgi:LAO/AO transport system kinase
LNSLVKGVLDKKISAAAFLIRKAEEEPPGVYEDLKALYPYTGNAHILGITGLPGSGKSTIINLLIKYYRSINKSVGVIAVDPSSPLSKGSILGDRIRMIEHSSDKEVFIKSLATRGWVGGLSKTTARVINILDAMGKDIILLETVGVGQTEVSIMNYAHTTVLVLVAEMGDFIQTIKAGVLEIGDIFVINKTDKRDPYDLQTNIESVIKNEKKDEKTWQKKVLLTSVVQNHGFTELVKLIEEHRKFFLKNNKDSYLEKRARQEIKEELIGNFIDYTNERVDANSQMQKTIDRICLKKEDPYSVSLNILHELNIKK